MQTWLLKQTGYSLPLCQDGGTEGLPGPVLPSSSLPAFPPWLQFPAGFSAPYLQICSSWWEEGKQRSRETGWSVDRIRMDPWRSVEARRKGQHFSWVPPSVQMKSLMCSLGGQGWSIEDVGSPWFIKTKKNKRDLGSFLGCMRSRCHLGWKFHMALRSSRANSFGIVKGIYQPAVSECLLSILGRN